MELSKEYRFEASHRLPKHKGQCARLHGHSWVFRVFVRGPIERASGFVMDYGDISEIVKPIIEKLDHRHLGSWEGFISSMHPWEDWAVPGLPINFNPTSENLLCWIAMQLSHTDLPWSKLELDETCTSRCTLTREEFHASRRQE